MSKHARHAKPKPAVARAAAISSTSAAVAALAVVAPVPAQAAVTVAPEGHWAATAEVPPDIKATALASSLARSVAAARPAAPAVLVVKTGDSLSALAQAHCGNAADWTGIWKANKAAIPNPNMIYPGQQLQQSCTEVVSLLGAGDPPPAPPQPAVTRDGDGDYDGDSSDGSTAQQPAQQSQVTVTGWSGTVSTAGMGAMQACIISRESGGNSQVMNSSSHYGLYQFSYSTWVAHGGSPADFGHASVAEQNRVYFSTVAADGYSDWSPYDGCLWNP